MKLLVFAKLLNPQTQLWIFFPHWPSDLLGSLKPTILRQNHPNTVEVATQLMGFMGHFQMSIQSQVSLSYPKKAQNFMPWQTRTCQGKYIIVIMVKNKIYNCKTRTVALTGMDLSQIYQQLLRRLGIYCPVVLRPQVEALPSLRRSTVWPWPETWM